MNTDLSSDEVMIDSVEPSMEKNDHDVTIISPPQSLNGTEGGDEAAELPPPRADDFEAIKRILFGNDAPLDVETEAVHTWEITNWKSMERRSHGPVFECGGSPWRVLFFPFGNNADCASFYLEQGYSDAPPKDWYKCVRFGLVLWNPRDPTNFHHHKATHRFTADEGDWGFTRFSELRELFKPKASNVRPLVEEESANMTAYVQIIKDPTGVLWHNWVGYDSKKETGFVGLKNQGATCYLNSLIQSYFFTNIFRKSVYKIPTEGEHPFTNSALALQRLLFLLQTSNEAVGTVELTKSFGWDAADTFSQQDVQELNRILLDRLEEKMKGTEVEKIMQKLFVGHSTTYIKCMNVDYASSKPEDYWDIQLNVRGFKNVQESLQEYIKPEIMDGENKYDAGEVHGHQDAQKGVIFNTFPDVLHLHLKRFDYDPATYQMQKVNDYYEFPEILDVSPYVAKPEDTSESWEYALHGVLIHSGDLNAGHYYSFLKPEKDGEFYKFDDDRVTRATKKEALDEHFGDLPKTAGQQPLRRASNAYMLIYYRRSKIDEILVPVTEQDVPPHLQRMFDEERAALEKRRREREEAHLYTTIKIATEEQINRHQGFDLIEFESKDSEAPPAPLTIRFRKDSTVRQLCDEVAAQSDAKPGSIRLWVMVNRQNKTVRPDQPFGEPDKRIVDAMPRETSKTDLRLWAEQINDVNAPWLTQDPSQWIVIFLKYYDPMAQSLNGYGHVYMRKSDKVADLVPHIAERMGWTKPELKLYEEIKPGMIEPMKPKQSFLQAEIQDGDIICFQKALTEKELELVKERKNVADARDFYDYLQNLITIKFTPKTQADEYPVFKLNLSKKMPYDDVAEKVGIYIDRPASHLRFSTMNQSTGQPRSVIKRNATQNLHQILSNPYYTNTHIAYNELFYEVLDISLAEMETKKYIKTFWLPDGIREEVPCDWLVPKNGTLADTIPLFKDRFKLSDEAVERIRFFQAHSGKIHKRLGYDYSVASMFDYTPTYAEVVPEEILNAGPDDLVIDCYQFYKEATKPHSIPFSFLVKKGEVFADTKKRLQTRTGIKGKLFEQIKFALVEENTSPLKTTYLQDDDILSDLATGPKFQLGLDRVDINGRNGAYRHGEIRIK